MDISQAGIRKSAQGIRCPSLTTIYVGPRGRSHLMSATNEERGVGQFTIFLTMLEEKGFSYFIFLGLG